MMTDVATKNLMENLSTRTMKVTNDAVASKKMVSAKIVNSNPEETARKNASNSSEVPGKAKSNTNLFMSCIVIQGKQSLFI